MNSKALLATGLIGVLVLGSYGMSSVAFGERYRGNVGYGGEIEQNSLEESLKLAKARIPAAQEIAEERYQAAQERAEERAKADSINTSIVIGTAFGSAAAVFFVWARSGKYAAMGQG